MPGPPPEHLRNPDHRRSRRARAAGCVAERLFLKDDGKLGDDDKPKAFANANIIAQSKRAKRHLVAAAKAEAEDVLLENAHLVRALASELLIKRTMDGAEIDEALARAEAAEQNRREVVETLRKQMLERQAALGLT